MKPLNRFFVCIYYLVSLVAGILHPVTVIGRENLPEHGALLCPNHNSNWDPVLVALKAAGELPAPHHGQEGAVLQQGL